MWQNLVLLFSLNSLFSNFAPNPVSHSCDSPPDKESSFSSLIYGQVHCSTIPSRPHAIKRWTLDTPKNNLHADGAAICQGWDVWVERGRSLRQGERGEEEEEDGMCDGNPQLQGSACSPDGQLLKASSPVGADQGDNDIRI